MLFWYQPAVYYVRPTFDQWRFGSDLRPDSLVLGF
jgi:hypothetical protein